METTRFILLIALALVLTMIWQAWQEDYVIPNKPGYSYETNIGATVTEVKPPDIPNVDTIELETTQAATVDAPTLSNTQTMGGEIIHVKTDVFEIEINTLGGTVQRLALTEYPLIKNQKDQPIILLRNTPDDFYLMQGGLLGEGDVANHKTLFQIERTNYELNNEESIKIPLVWESTKGITVVKTFTFYKGQYIADVNYQITNNSYEPWVGRAYGQLNRTEPRENGSRFIYTYTGAVISSPEKRYDKIDFGDIQDEKLSVDITNGWVAMLQHYFFTALIPGSKKEKYHYYTLNPDNRSYVIGVISPSKSIAVGASENLNHRVYFGPKLQKEIKQFAEGLDLTVDYGIFWFLAKPLYWVLDYINSFTNNWGWSIILVTLLLKLLFFKLSAAGYRSMANMRRVQPRLLSIRDRYKDDRARLNQAMMDIYKEEKINPLGGCFPILVQIPVFISLYWVLLESVELRQADFILWINDLSVADPYFVLPLLMGITMFVQQKLNPAPMDPVQAKVMSVLPVVFTVFFAFFPAGLVLYWVVNNTLSIAQQWVITRNLEQASS